MNRREKTLAITFFAAAAIVSANTLGTWQAPHGKQQLLARLAKSSSSLRSAEQELEALRKQRTEIEDAKKSGLTGNPTQAMLMYQEILVEFMRQSGIAFPSISAGSPIPEPGLGNRISFSLQMEASTDQLGSLLDRLEATEILHRIKLITIHPKNAVDSDLCSIAMQIEALLIDDADGKPIAPLLEPTIQTHYGQQLSSMQLIGRSKKAQIVDFNLASILPFNTDANAQDAEVTSNKQDELTPELLTSAQAADTFQLVGVVVHGVERKAMIYRSLAQELLTVKLQDGIPGMQHGDTPKVTAIKHDSIQINQHGVERTIYIGEQL